MKTVKTWLGLPLLMCLFLALMVVINKPMGKIDRAWSDIILTSKKVPIEQSYLIVDVTVQDLDKFGGPPFPRDVLAKALNRLDELGADKILLDLNLSGERSSKHDHQLVAAMGSLGPDRLAIAQGADTKFEPHASLVDLALLPDQDGWTRTVRTKRQNTGNNPSRWLAHGQLSQNTAQLDLRYDLSSLDRITLSDVFESSDINISGRKIVISPDASVLTSRIQLPLTKTGDRSATIVLGSESISRGYAAKAQTSWRASFFLALIFMSVGMVLAVFVNKVRLIILAAFTMSIIAVFVNMFMMKLWGGPGYPIMHFICFLIGLIVTLGSRLRLFQMITTFLKGDLSPEEAWSWRSYEDNPAPVILLDAMGNIRRMNGAAQVLSDILGSDFGERCFSEFRQNSNQISVSDAQGQTRYFSIDWPNNNVPLVVMKDVTETARQFNDLEANRRHLEKSIEHLRDSQSRAVELADTYERQKSRAEETSQLKSDFLANMSHELRTPLNAINGFSDIMQKELFGPLGDPRYKTFAADILFSGQHLLSLINDILDLSKIEAGKKELSFEPVQLSDVIGQAVRMSRIRAKDKAINLIYDEKDVPQINADPRALKQILLNLLTNAIKFTPAEGTVTVSVQVRSMDMVVAVTDTGIGISQEDIERLAQPFAQVDNQETKNQEGTGLGLSLAKSLAELHGGQFKIASTLGVGTTMMFSLPYTPTQTQANPTQTVPEVKSVA